MISVAKPVMGSEELDNIKAVLGTGWLGMGDRVFQFEQKLKSLLGRKHVIAVNTGTAAIHLAVDALGINPGDEVIVPSLTFVASVQPVILSGGRPVFCEVDPETLNLDIGHVKKLITSRTKAIIPVHYGGDPCDMELLLGIAESKGITVIDDAAHAFGSKYKGKLVGSIGHMTCFSFDPIKNVTCGEGGAVVLDDDERAQLIIKKRILGIDKDTWNRYKHTRSWFYEVQTTGYRYHMSNINAAIGLAQLEKMEGFFSVRRDVARFYDEALSGVRQIKIFKRDYSKVVPFNYTILAEKRDELMEFLSKHGVGTVINYIPNHIQPLFAGEGISLPVTEKIYGDMVSIPMHAALSMEDARQVVDAIKTYYKA